jgi:DNA-binding MarR family transcriptional regulator
LICKVNAAPNLRRLRLEQTKQNKQVKSKRRQVKVMHPTKLDEIHLQVLHTIEAEPELTQRQLAEELGVSLGKAHYCIKALIDKGLVKMGNLATIKRSSITPTS